MPHRRAAAFALMALLSIPRVVLGAGADQPLPVYDKPIFDTHVHYSQPAWEAFPPAAVFRKMDAAGIVRALVSSTPDDGTLTLYRLDGDRIIPFLRPYHDGAGILNWQNEEAVPAYLSKRLAQNIYGGIGEFHLFYETDTPTVRRVIEMAVARGIYLHVHSDAAHVAALFAIEPKVKILWAHAGLETDPGEVRALLDRYPRLWADLAFRDGDIATNNPKDGGLDPEWRALLVAHADRFTVGTDTYVNERWDGYQAVVDEQRRWLARLPAAAAAAIARENAMRLFGAGTPPGNGNRK